MAHPMQPSDVPDDFSDSTATNGFFSLEPSNQAPFAIGHDAFSQFPLSFQHQGHLQSAQPIDYDNLYPPRAHISMNATRPSVQSSPHLSSGHAFAHRPRTYQSEPASHSHNYMLPSSSGVYPENKDDALPVSVNRSTPNDTNSTILPYFPSHAFGMQQADAGHTPNFLQYDASSSQQSGYGMIGPGPSLAAPSRKRPRYNSDTSSLGIEESHAAAESSNLATAPGQISADLERQVLNFLRDWFSSFSYNSLPEPTDVEAFVTLTRLSSSAVNRLLFRALQGEGVPIFQHHLPPADKAIHFFRCWLSSFSMDALPGASDVAALAILTRLSELEVERLFVQMLLATHTGTTHDPAPGNLPSQAGRLPQEDNGLAGSRSFIFEDAVGWALRRGPQCQPKMDGTVLQRSPNQHNIYQCTRKCGKAFRRRDDWRRHEEDKNYPQEGWVCNLHSTCVVRGVQVCSYCDIRSPAANHVDEHHRARTACCNKQLKGRIFFRKDKFIDHCTKIHPAIDAQEQSFESRIQINSRFPTHCGFCNELQIDSWQHRCDHIATHFEAGKDMTEWIEPSDSTWNADDNGDSDDDDDNNDGDAYYDNGNLGSANRYGNGSRNNGFKGASGDSAYGSKKTSRNSSSNNTGTSSGSQRHNKLQMDPKSAKETKNCSEYHQEAFLSVDGILFGQQRLSSSAADDNENLTPVADPLVLPMSHHPQDVKVITNEAVSKKPAVDVSHALAHRPRFSHIREKLNNVRKGFTRKLSTSTGNHTVRTPELGCHKLPTLSSSASSVVKTRCIEATPGSTSFVSSSTTLNTVRLEHRILEAMIPLWDNRFFLPNDALSQLFTREAVENELDHDADFSPKSREVVAQIITADCRRLFAILIYLGKGPSIVSFIELGNSDADLPFRLPRFSGRVKTTLEWQVFESWSYRDIHDFSRIQWYFISPTFDTGAGTVHHTFDDNVILPFIMDNKKSAEAGGYSEVWKVRIHEAHFKSQAVQGTCLALKRPFSTNEADFYREANMLKRLSTPGHPHLVRLLATYQFRGRYHMLFPCAQSNLRRYWEQAPKPVFSAVVYLWVLQQMRGLASALDTIHNYRGPHTDFADPSDYAGEKLDRLTISKGEQTFGRHGDLKPENILWFNDIEHSGSKGILVIADMGLGRFHGLETRSKVRPHSVATTPTYEAPEITLRQSVSRAYDIWSLGCIFLEFITWMLDGQQGLSDFEIARELEVGGVYESKFFTMRQDSDNFQWIATINPGVREFFTRLRQHENSSPMIHDLLYIIEARMLVINAKSRIGASKLVKSLRTLEEISGMDDFYLLGREPTPFEVAAAARNRRARGSVAPSTTSVGSKWQSRELDGKIGEQLPAYDPPTITVHAATE